MQSHSSQNHVHEHVFDTTNSAAESGTRTVMWISAAMMVIEIVCGYALNSMALLADGWHMSSHTLAIGLSALAYAAARKYAKDPRFAFGTWKIEVLGGFTSAIFLLGVALTMLVSSLERLYAPQAIAHLEAVWVAVLGLVVNLVCAMILAKSGQGHDHHGHSHHNHHDHHDHDHDNDHDHDQGHHAHPADAPHAPKTGHVSPGDHAGHAHAVASTVSVNPLTSEVQAHLSAAQGHDLNLRSAYIHILADAATSVLAIVSLLLGWAYGWDLLDPLVGILGGILIALWSKNLLKETAKVLLDCEMDHPKYDQVKRCILDLVGGQEAALADLHVWRVGKKNFSCALVVVTSDAQVTPRLIRAKLLALGGIAHSTIEVNHH
jgi:cation diffusion facilitator family transporter